MSSSERVSGLALARLEGQNLAIAWVDAAIAALRWFSRNGGAPSDRASRVTLSALNVNFAWAKRGRIGRWAALRTIQSRFVESRALIRAWKRFADADPADLERWWGDGSPPPAYAIFGDRVYFTASFAPWDGEHGFGPRCRAAMVVHETIHLIDSTSGDPEVHISEWDEPRFSNRTPAQQLRNPSAYASFAGQVFTKAEAWPPEARYGAGSPHL